MQRTGVFGSAFNPPTKGHRDVLRQAASEFDTILLVPSLAHAFSKESIAIDVREELLKAFCKDTADLSCRLEISLLEKTLLEKSPDTPVYTWTLLDALSEKEPDTQFSFIRGPDNASPETWQRFYRYKDIEQRWPVFTAKENIQARSSLVREQLACESVDEDELKKMLTPSVMALILQKHLYRAT